MDGDVCDLINVLNKMNKEESTLINSIKNLDLLLEGLRELDQMIEMENVKKSIVIQIKFLIINYVNMKNKKMDKHMIHTVLSGPPGVGKTELGTILAKIWLGLGLVGSNDVSKSALLTDDRKSFKDDQRSFKDDDSKTVREIKNLKLSGKIKNGVIKNLQDHVKNIKSQLRVAETRSIIYKVKTLKREIDKTHHKTLDTIVEEIKTLDTIIQNAVETEISDERVHFLAPFQEVVEKKESSLISIVSREDFVAGFVGQTALKTEKLLRDNFGKILFIDEAYSLINDEKDSFGMEALTILNRYMSEFSDQIIIIFAGYKDMLDQTIFKYQPGLKRRCSWYFEITGYTEKGLAEIFLKQLRETEWKLASEVDLVSFFKTHRNLFPNYGGSTLQLAFYCKLAYSTQIFNQSRDNDQIVDQKILNEALGFLRDNNFHKEDTFIHHMYL